MWQKLRGKYHQKYRYPIGGGVGGALATAGIRKYNSAKYRKLVKRGATKAELRDEENRAVSREGIATSLGSGIGMGVGFHYSNKLANKVDPPRKNPDS